MGAQNGFQPEWHHPPPPPTPSRNGGLWLSPSFVNDFPISGGFSPCYNPHAGFHILVVHSVLSFVVSPPWWVWSALLACRRRAPDSLQTLKSRPSPPPTQFRERKPRFPEDGIKARHSHTCHFLGSSQHPAECFVFTDGETETKASRKQGSGVQTHGCLRPSLCHPAPGYAGFGIVERILKQHSECKCAHTFLYNLSVTISVMKSAWHLLKYLSMNDTLQSIHS